MSAQYCFVIMSFNKSKPWLKRRFEEAIRPTVEQFFEYRCVRTLDLHYNGRITDEIWKRIREADFIIADLTDNSPNCYYELGIAHALDKIVIPIIDTADDIPFDVQDYNFIIAPNPAALRKGLKPRLMGTLQLRPNTRAKGDPQRGLWGKRAKHKDRQLSAAVTPIPGNEDFFQIVLKVVSTDPAKPLTGEVLFHLHDTFDPPVRVVKVKRGEAVLELLAWGCFTVGAEVDNRQTKLELNLCADKSYPPLFRKR